MRRFLTLTVAALLLVSLAAPVGATVATGSSTAVSQETTPTDDPEAVCEGNSTETIGYWEGICHDSQLDIDQANGLTEEELERLVHLKMARVEYLRERPFKQEVPVETMTRTEYVEMVGSGESDETFNRWNDQVWKALFIVGADDSSEEAIQGVFSGAVAGFYSPAQDRIVLVVGEDEDLQISGATLLHELGHAMQDQYHNLSEPRYIGETQDADLAIDGIVEGEVVYLENRYEERCDGGEWDCIGDPSTNAGGGVPDGFNWGIYLTVFHPYSDGGAYVAEIVEEDGWEGVSQRMESPPQTTSEIIHGEAPMNRTISFNDTARNGWEIYPDQGANGSDTVGEASMFVMFWHQSREYGADTFDWRRVLNDVSLSHPDSVYNYAHESTDGWAGDELYPYRNENEIVTRDGYVWVTEWETPRDAAQFHATYDRMLDAHDATRNDDGTISIPRGPFRGAYGIDRSGTTVTIVHGPEPRDITDISPEIELETETEEPVVTEPTPEPNEETPADANTPTETEPTADDTPGFGVGIGLIAIVVATLIAVRGTGR